MARFEPAHVPSGRIGPSFPGGHRAARTPENAGPVLRALVLTLTLATAGCFGTTHLYYSQASLQGQEDRVKVTDKTYNWLWGLVDGRGAVMGAACGTNGVATVEVEHGIGDWLWFVFTAGIYDRTTVTFSCQ